MVSADSALARRARLVTVILTCWPQAAVPESRIMSTPPARRARAMAECAQDAPPLTARQLQPPGAPGCPNLGVACPSRRVACPTPWCQPEVTAAPRGRSMTAARSLVAAVPMLLTPKLTQATEPQRPGPNTLIWGVTRGAAGGPGRGGGGGGRLGGGVGGGGGGGGGVGGRG